MRSHATVVTGWIEITLPNGQIVKAPFGQDWTDTGLISANDNWSGVSGVIGYRGDDLTTVTGADP